MDLFALKINTKLATYISPIKEETSWKVDSLVQNWDGLYAYAYPPTSLSKQGQNRKRRDRPDRARLAQSGVVPGPIRSRDSLSNSSLTSAETAQADFLTPLSSASVESQHSRLEVIKGFHKERGFSEAVAQRLAISRQSSAGVYESKWKVFSNVQRVVPC